MNIIYTRLFNLSIRHNYYENGLAKGVSLWPTAETSKLMKGGRMLFKRTPKGVVVLYRTQEDEVISFVDLGKDVRLTFELSIANRNEFLNITDLDESPSRKYSSSNILYFKNDPASASIDPEAPEVLGYEIIDFIEGRLFTFSFGLGSSLAQVLLRVSNEDGTLVSVGNHTDGTPFADTLTLDRQSDDSYSQQIDLRDQAKGRYSITIRNTADTITLLEKEVYLDEDMVGRNLSGIVEIIYDTAEDRIYNDTEEYAMQFNRQASLWKYFVVNKSKTHDFSSDTFTIDDSSSGTRPYVVNTFALSGSAPSADVEVIGLDTLVFLSDDAIPFYEVPKTSIELNKNALASPVINHLPNPHHRGVLNEESGSLASEIYVFI